MSAAHEQERVEDWERSAGADAQPEDHPAGRIRLTPRVTVGARAYALLGLAATAAATCPSWSVHPTSTFV